MSALPLEAVSEFLKRRDQFLAVSPTRIRYTLRASLFRPNETLCWHCGAPAKHGEALVPECAGGPARMGNLVAACHSCHLSRGGMDAREFAEAAGRTLTSEQEKVRIAALALSAQHPVPPKATRSRQACFEYLKETRWTHARVALAVEVVDGQVLIAPVSDKPSSYCGALMRSIREAGGEPIGEAVWCMKLEQWQALAPALIERHAIIRVISGEAKKNQPPLEGGWSVLLEGLDDVRRGRPRKPHQGFTSSARSRAWGRPAGLRA